MPKAAKPMRAMEVAHLKEPGVYAVGGAPGLALQVTVPTDKGDQEAPAQVATPARSWLLRAMVLGKRREMGLGSYPEVSLAQARERALEARAKIRDGVDPIQQRRTQRSETMSQNAAALTFKRCAEAYIATHAAGWKNLKHGQQWANTLETYAYPVLGALLVRDVAREHVLEVLRPIWTEKNETAVRLRGRIELVLSYAMQAGYRPEGLNPARWKGGLDKLLPAPSKVNGREHHRALAVGSVGAFMARLRAAEGMGARALEFVILTAARSGEVRGATWAEVDLAAKVWTVPASRMKAGKEHRVPLSPEALALLAALPQVEGDDLIFKAAKGGALSDMTLSAVLRRMKVDAVPHGFRSTFRDWAAERTAYPGEAAEMALAHAIGDKVEAAYRRGDMFEKRRQMMADWAQFLGKVEQ
jgi:integrase